MSFGSGKKYITSKDLTKTISEIDILGYYINVSTLPIVINSPIRKDEHPSFGLYCTRDLKVRYIDLATKEKGGLFDLLMKLWNCNYTEALDKVYSDLLKKKENNLDTNVKKISDIKILSPEKKTFISNINITAESILNCKIREWEDYDIEYWNSYGIDIEWLKYADVHPISHKIITKDGKTYTFKADKYAYVYVERKEKKITLKIYQPFNTNGYKWSNKHNRSVLSLWSKIPKIGERVCVCSSLKDALCLWSNTGIPAIAVQGEGYTISDTAIKELKKRFSNIYICFDNDEVGLKDAQNLSILTGFKNVILPPFTGGKDISDLFKITNNKEKFKQQILKLFKENE